MLNKKWIVLLASLVCTILCLSPYINKYDALGLISFGIIFCAIPYVLYRALPTHQLSLLIAIGTPIPLIFAYGYWLGFYEDYYLSKEGIRTRAVVTATWISTTRHNGKQRLFRVRFKTAYDYREIFSHTNKKGYQVGDSVTVDYLPSEPNTYRIVD